MPLLGIEAGAAAAAAWLASAIIAAYGTDWLDLFVAPLVILALSLASAAVLWLKLRRRAAPDAAALSSFASVVLVTFTWLMWRARPDFLPTGTGSDLAHHLPWLPTSSVTVVWCTMARSAPISAK
ncbi:MAG: hypothetical protein ACRD2I_26035 [Vicinamibacterales bacterium]